MERNYLQIANVDYYMPREIQEGLILEKIPDTSIPDPIDALYSD